MERVTGRVGDAIGAITRHIREHHMMPGDQLPSEALLPKELNVSRTVVREAFRSLAAIRIIDLATGKRATFAQIDHGAMSLCDRARGPHRPDQHPAHL